MAVTPLLVEVRDLRTAIDRLPANCGRAGLVRALPMLAREGMTRSLESFVEGTPSPGMPVRDSLPQQL
jgi:hypothetical protein